MSVFQNLWADITTAYHEAVTDLTAFLNGFFASAISQVANAGGQVLVNAATAAVTAAENTGGSGAAKFNAAVASVKTVLTSQGIPVVENAVQSAVLAGVANLQAAQAAGTVPAATTNTPVQS